ncbi:MAG TPA: SMP-30/gluconolactonase/LRE family protein [Kineosporiaceae bacterium]|nr:SMP-30/gluconolactonase/LRE family protein [Kineosporiaceae bacterium]
MSGLLAGSPLEKVASGAIWAEGPVWLPGRRAVRYSDVIGNRILEFSEATGELTVYDAAAEHANGRTLDLDGAVVQCSHGRRAIERDDGVTTTTLVDHWRDRRLNSPNDVVVKSDGTIWFTDPSYGIQKAGEGHPGEVEYGDHVVFRFDPSTGDLDPVVIDVLMPNGLAFSPDESVLYVADSSLVPPDGRSDRLTGHAIHAYDVVDGRRAKNGRTFVEVSPGLPDGIRVDVHGNVWSSCEDGVQVYSPDGELVERIPVPEVVANLCFGGHDGTVLYITATSSLYRIATTTTDAVRLARSPRVPT